MMQGVLCTKFALLQLAFVALKETNQTLIDC